MAGTWCVFAFFLVSFYTTTLISFVTSPNEQPLVNSVYDIPKKAGVNIVFDKRQYIDILLSVLFLAWCFLAVSVANNFNNLVINYSQTADSGILKNLAESVKRDPSLGCTTKEMCLQKVRDGLHVYIEVNIWKYD